MEVLLELSLWQCLVTEQYLPLLCATVNEDCID